MTVTCTVCGAAHERPEGSTWHQNQCDDCITAWAADKAERDADAAITCPRPRQSVINEMVRIRDIWRPKR